MLFLVSIFQSSPDVYSFFGNTNIQFFFIIFFLLISRSAFPIPPWFLGVAGIFEDFFSGPPFGAHALSFFFIGNVLLKYLSILRNFPFLMEWLSFAIALLVKNIIVLGLLLITMSPSASLAQIVMYSFVTILVYPIFFIVSKFFLKSEKDTSTDENWRKENIL